MICWMHDIANNVCMKFLLNPGTYAQQMFCLVKSFIAWNVLPPFLRMCLVAVPTLA